MKILEIGKESDTLHKVEQSPKNSKLLIIKTGEKDNETSFSNIIINPKFYIQSKTILVLFNKTFLEKQKTKKCHCRQICSIRNVQESSSDLRELPHDGISTVKNVDNQN